MTSTEIDREKLAAITLQKGAHFNPDDGLCLMEAVAYLRGLPHSDEPPCVSSVLAGFGRSLNDVLPDDLRQELKQLIPMLPGTADDGKDEARGYLALDWMIRVYTPAWLSLAGLSDVAAELRALDRIVDLPSAYRARSVVQVSSEKAREQRSAAWDAARNAAWDAARSAARDAAWDAAGDAAWDAARNAARAAAGAAARAAARDAAEAAARDAGWEAAWDALAPTVVELQRSAIALYVSMVDPK